VIGKQPKDIFVWILEGQVPGPARSQEAAFPQAQAGRALISGCLPEQR
jgi:hypothetical protein